MKRIGLPSVYLIMISTHYDGHLRMVSVSVPARDYSSQGLYLIAREFAEQWGDEWIGTGVAECRAFFDDLDVVIMRSVLDEEGYYFGDESDSSELQYLFDTCDFGRCVEESVSYQEVFEERLHEHLEDDHEASRIIESFDLENAWAMNMGSLLGDSGSQLWSELPEQVAEFDEAGL